MPFCPMCEKEVPALHKKNHVLPDWMYDDCKDELNRIIVTSFEDERAKFEQSGRYGTYWCPNCEDESSWWDDYASRVLTKERKQSKEGQQVEVRPIVLESDGKSVPVVQWSGFDYKSLSRFVFICCIRAHLDRLSLSQKPLLTDAEFRALRFNYKTNFLDDKTFPIFGYADTDAAKYRSLVMSPVESLMGGNRCIHFKGPGLAFCVQLENAHANPPGLSQLRLSTSGEFLTLIWNYEETEDFRKTLPKLRSILEKYPPAKFEPKRK